MKRQSLKLGIVFLIALGLTVFLYWPVYQRILLTNSKSDIDTEINRLDLPLGDDIKEILDRKIDLPPNRHELCLLNRNQIHLIHADSSSGPYTFYTDDISQSDIAKSNNVGAMAIKINYDNGQASDEIYRNATAEKLCLTLQTSKLRNYASSTIEYHHFGFGMLEEFDLGEKGKIQISRPVVGASLINTQQSSVFIIARWKFFLLTLGVLFTLVLLVVNWILKRLHNDQKT